MRSGETRGRRNQRGFGYLMVLFALAAMGALAAATGQVWHTTVQREREAELLAIGNQFSNAFASYYRSTPGPNKQWPGSLDDLLTDQRSGKTVRHLRILYADPMTGSRAWGLVRESNGIKGVYSLSTQHPLKIAFKGPEDSFAGAERYDQWVFDAKLAAARHASSNAAVPVAGGATPGAARPDGATPAAAPPAEDIPGNPTGPDTSPSNRPPANNGPCIPVTASCNSTPRP